VQGPTADGVSRFQGPRLAGVIPAFRGSGEAADEHLECVSPERFLPPAGECATQLDGREAFGEGVEREDSVHHRPPAEAAGVLESRHAGDEAGERPGLGGPEIGGDVGCDRNVLEADLQQGRMLEGEPPEHESRRDEVRSRVRRRRKGVELRFENLECPLAERSEEGLLGAEDAVDGAGGRADLPRDPSDGEGIDAFGVDDPLGRAEERSGGGLVMHPRSSHGPSVARHCYDTVYRNSRKDWTSMTMTTPAGHAASPAGSPDWGVGRYEPTGEQLAPASVRAVQCAAPTPGEVVLDVGCGSGNAALLAAATGARVTGIDPAPRLLGVARDRAAAEGREIAFLEGSSEALPVADASVDVVLSVFGVVFSRDPRRAAAELMRVTAEPGRIVLTAWLPGGAMSEVASVSQAAVLRALGRESPPAFAWHDRETLEGVFGPHGFSVELEEATLTHSGPSLDAFISDVLEVHPLAVAGRALLERNGQAEGLRARTRAILAEGNEDSEGFAVVSRYVLVTVRRSSDG
jgi:SAM-dependent methyltransferase